MRTNLSQEECFGPLPGNIGNHQTFFNNAANRWIAFSFFSHENKTLNILRMYQVGAPVGSPQSNIEFHIYSDNAGSPNTSLSSQTPTDAYPTNGWFTVSGFTQNITANTRYWVVVKNVHATPASNYITMLWSVNGGGPAWRANDPYSLGKYQTTDGSTWTGANANILPALQIGFSDSTFIGSDIESAVSADTDFIYAAREFGNYFVSGPVKMAARGIAAFIPAESGTPTGNLIAKLYKGTSLIATSATQYTPTQVAGSGVYTFSFSSTVAIAPNTPHRVVLAETTQSDASGNRFNVPSTAFESAGTYSYLRPMAGVWYKTYYDGSNWTETTNKIAPVALIPDMTSGGGFVPIGTSVS